MDKLMMSTLSSAACKCNVESYFVLHVNMQVCLLQHFAFRNVSVEFGKSPHRGWGYLSFMCVCVCVERERERERERYNLGVQVKLATTVSLIASSGLVGLL
jgi:hypothetical protein